MTTATCSVCRGLYLARDYATLPILTIISAGLVRFVEKRLPKAGIPLR